VEVNDVVGGLETCNPIQFKY